MISGDSLLRIYYEVIPIKIFSQNKENVFKSSPDKGRSLRRAQSHPSKYRFSHLVT